MAAAVKLAVLLIVLLNINHCTSDGLAVGINNGQLIFTKNVQLSSIPFTSRNKNVFYNGNQTIKGINVVDIEKSKGEVSLTSGGIGFTYANIRIKGESGEKLNYLVQIFV